MLIVVAGASIIVLLGCIGQLAIHSLPNKWGTCKCVMLFDMKNVQVCEMIGQAYKEGFIGKI